MIVNLYICIISYTFIKIELMFYSTEINVPRSTSGGECPGDG